MAMCDICTCKMDVHFNKCINTYDIDKLRYTTLITFMAAHMATSRTQATLT